MKDITKADLETIDPKFAFIDWRPEKPAPDDNGKTRTARNNDTAADSRVLPGHAAL